MSRGLYATSPQEQNRGNMVPCAWCSVNLSDMGAIQRRIEAAAAATAAFASGQARCLLRTPPAAAATAGDLN